jgi:hypothetical protein
VVIMASMIHGIVEIIQVECRHCGLWNDVWNGNLSNRVFTAELFINALKIVSARPNVFNGTGRLVRSGIVVCLTQLGDSSQIGAD